jgi:2-octaprenyl-6-methoxyphenol hydroxylase
LFSVNRDPATPMASTQTTPVAVIGGGPAGLVAALALAHVGVPAVLVAPGPSRDPARPSEEACGTPAVPGTSTHVDNRTTALMRPSVTALEALGVWLRCRDHAAPLQMMRIVDDTGRLWRAPEVRFEAAEIGLEAFAWNIENRHLVAALWEQVAATPLLTHVAASAASLDIRTPGSSGATVTLTDGSALRCRLVVAADGRNSICRAAAGIAMDSRGYPQTALTFNLAHARPHHGISTEFHTAHGPFTLVPLPGDRSSLVWVAASEEAARVGALTGAALDMEIERRAHSILGTMQVEPGHGTFPMSVATARTFGANRVALVGEAAHLFPPIGAQGLNLGLRDAITIAEIAGGIYRRDDGSNGGGSGGGDMVGGGDLGGGDAGGGDLGGAAEVYDRRRRADITGRTVAVDLLNRSLLSDLLAVQGLRGLGLYALDRIGPLRRFAMREGVAPHAGLPGLMREKHA